MSTAPLPVLAVPPSTEPWRSPWSNVWTPSMSGYVALDDGRVLACSSNDSANPVVLKLGYAPSVDDLLAANGSVTFDRDLVTATGGSSPAQRSLTGSLYRDPDDNSIILIWGRGPSNATWTYGSGFPAPSSPPGTFIYRTTDDGATWTEIAAMGAAVAGATITTSHGCGPLQRTSGGTYLLCGMANQQRRIIYGSADRVTWTRRGTQISVGPWFAERDGKIYNLSDDGLLASADDGATWSVTDSSTTGTAGPWFTYTLPSDPTVYHGIIRRPTGSISQVIRWESTDDIDPNFSDFTVDSTFDPTGVALPATWTPHLCGLDGTRMGIISRHRILGFNISPPVPLCPPLPPLHIPHKSPKSVLSSSLTRQNLLAISRWADLTYRRGSTSSPLHIPHLSPTSPRHHLVNLLAITRWSRTLCNSTSPLHFPRIDDHSTYADLNYLSLERWAARQRNRYR